MENWREFGPIVDGVTKRRNIKGRILCVLWPPRLVKIDGVVVVAIDGG